MRGNGDGRKVDAKAKEFGLDKLRGRISRQAHIQMDLCPDCKMINTCACPDPPPGPGLFPFGTCHRGW
ncbi:Uncharacterized protein TCM_011910 [Theobroma cacao]|uniref:Uncharacterized protein n=1 Tax=Theobroma cacao TaxID=3641 RepID=A0A061ECU7_THECC|nr:Uncharacterized protein TCM_011910 [Theobroma cacao]